ncbi:glycosyltransferase family 4 protein [Pontibacterium granulatum]|uniref:glycosyltransferase family 4 protein n=1 Tax=Pontibacterium granulatum TaxID=2036029 RepID=UPI00249ABC13|nr:glycosyltransferase family 4 protein [Pontibacterium granulatum]MDI3323044.1 glycosyltransferase family 4 protein [Pontibacterium granulatum]
MPDSYILHLCSYFIGSKVYKHLFEELAKQPTVRTQDVFVPIRTDRHNGANLLNVDNVFIYYIKSLGLSTRLSLALKQFRLKQAFSTFYRQQNAPPYTCIHAHTLYSDGILAWRLHRELGIPYIITVRTTDVDIFNRLSPQWEPVIRKVLRDAKTVIFISPAHKHKFEAKYGATLPHTQLMPNGINQHWLAQSNTAKLSDISDITRGLYIGAINRNKNIARTIEAFLNAKLDTPERLMTIVGGSYEEYTKCYGPLSEKQLASVNFAGRITDLEALQKYYKEANIFIMPSHMETFGLVYLEAISQCTPVIYSRGQAIDGLFPEGEVGVACDSRSTTSIQGAIEYILQHYPVGLTYRNGKNPVQEFSWRRVATALATEVYV